MIVDSLAFCGPCLFGWEAPADQVVGALDASEADRGVVVAPKPPEYHLEPANDAIADAVRRHADRLAGLVRVDPWRPAAAAEVERGLGDLGLSGLFLHPWEERFRVNMPAVDALVEVARRHAAPVVIATGFPWLSEALQVGDLASRFPDVPFVMTTGGQINISGLGQEDAQLAAKANANISLQTAGVYREDFIEGIVAAIGAQRVLYASGYPQFEPRLERRRVQWAPALSDDDKARIMGANAGALFGLRP